VNAAIQEALLPIDALDIRARIRALLWFEYQIQMQEAVDPLQTYAEQSGLVQEIGQDAVQEIIGAPFVRFRAIAAAREQQLLEIEAAEEEAAWNYDNGYAARIIARWEAEDANRRSEPSAPQKREYRLPQSTIDAFWHVVRLDDPDHLARWLAQHPADAPHLHEIWGRKCSTVAA
jgi:hypothetical protein